MSKTMRVGDSVTISKSFSEEDVMRFAEISTDNNPIHLDPVYAKETVFGQRIVHGMLVASLFSGLIGNKLPGEGSVYLGQTLKFLKPVFLGEEVTARVEIINIREDKPIITLKTLCTNQSGEAVIEGEAVVKI